MEASFLINIIFLLSITIIPFHIIAPQMSKDRYGLVSFVITIVIVGNAAVNKLFSGEAWVNIINGGLSAGIVAIIMAELYLLWSMGRR